MKYEILTGPSYALAEVELSEGERIVTEPGAMAWMDDNIEVETKMKGGLLSGLKRKIAGESFFQNTYVCNSGRGKIGLAPGIAGDVVAIDIDGEILTERAAYMASAGNIEVSASWEGFQGMFSEGLVALKARGNGTLFFNAYGDIQEIDVKGGYAVDCQSCLCFLPNSQLSLKPLNNDEIKMLMREEQTFEIVKMVHDYRLYFKPEKVKTVLLAESHVYTSDDDFQSELPSDYLSGYPKKYVRFVYCLGYGENELLNKPVPKNSGTPEFWKIFYIN